METTAALKKIMNEMQKADIHSQNTGLRVWQLLTGMVELVIIGYIVATGGDRIRLIRRNAGFLRIMPRLGWGALEPRDELEVLEKPVHTVIICHSASSIGCGKTTEGCCAEVRRIQECNITSTVAPMDDICYNYLIGGDAVIYEGRGHEYVGAFLRGWNRTCLGIGFIGNFIQEAPSRDVLLATELALDYFVDIGVLSPDYALYGHCQVSDRFPDSPGAALMEKLQKFKHWKRWTPQ